jgi:hypothetical protein
MIAARIRGNRSKMPPPISAPIAAMPAHGFEKPCNKNQAPSRSRVPGP